MKAKILNFFNNTMDFINLKDEIRYLKKELEESKSKERPYIDKIQSLKSDNRVLKIINTKNEKKIQTLKDRISELEEKQGTFFGE